MSIRVLGEQWLPTSSTFRVQSSCRGLRADVLVYELIDPVSRTWNTTLIRDNFWEGEAKVICSLPVSKYNQPDRRIWGKTKNGDFSVRSAYYLEKERIAMKHGEGSSVLVCNIIWKKIWALMVPNPTKGFLWRVCNNILPTKDNLRTRGVVPDENCMFCCTKKESIVHALWECPAAQDVWGVCGRSIQKSSFTGHTFRDILLWLDSRCNTEEMALVGVVAKGIWHRQNTVVHGGAFLHPSVLVREAKSYLQQFKDSLERTEELVQSIPINGPFRWKNPPVNFFKANWDVALQKDCNWMGCGVVVRDHEGLVCAALSKTIEGCPDPTTAEAMGALCAMEFCRDLGEQDLILEGDSKVVVQTLKSPGPIWCSYRPVISDTVQVANGFRSWTVEHVSREGNHAAHRLGKLAVQEVRKGIWMEEVPCIIQDVVTLELQALSV